MEQIPVIMLTAKSEEADKLKGFSSRGRRLYHQAIFLV